MWPTHHCDLPVLFCNFDPVQLIFQKIRYCQKCGDWQMQFVIFVKQDKWLEKTCAVSSKPILVIALGKHGLIIRHDRERKCVIAVKEWRVSQWTEDIRSAMAFMPLYGLQGGQAPAVNGTPLAWHHGRSWWRDWFLAGAPSHQTQSERERETS